MDNRQRFTFHGLYFDGRSSQSQQVSCTVDQDGLVVGGPGGEELLNLSLQQCVLTPPLAASRRYLKFPGGERLQVDDTAVLNFLAVQLASHRGLHFVHVLESHWRLVAACVAGLLICVWAFMTFAIPKLAHKVAQATPPSLMATISDDTLALLDKRFFAISGLDAARQQEIEGIFGRLCHDFVPGQACRLVFRKGGSLGANAFALPAGVVIVTDELVALAESNAELAGVLAHELVHVKERHGLRHVIQQAGVFLLISTLMGDMTSLSSLGSTLPMMLIESGYSRQFEQEADENASRYFLKKGQSVQPYKDMLFRLTKDQHLPGVATFLASHPNPDQRLQAIEEVERGGSQ